MKARHGSPCVWHSRHMRLVFFVLVAAWCCPQQVDAVVFDHETRCIRSTPRQLSTDQAKSLCINARAQGLDDGPARCASRVLKNSYAATLKPDDVVDLIELCQSAVDTRPAECWSAVPKDWRRHVIPVCKNAVNERAMECLLQFKRHVLTVRQARSIETITQICSEFRGDPATIGDCLRRAPRSLPERMRYQLCRRGQPSAVGDVVECSKQLLQRNANAEIVTAVCSSAEASTDSPQACVLAAQQRLRWMDTQSIIELCLHSQARSAPVDCVTSLRSWFTSEFSKSQSLNDLARLCHNVSDPVQVVQCVKKLPSRLFTSSQVVRICGKQVEEASHHGDKANCVVSAAQQLFKIGNGGGVTREQQALLLLQLCGGINASSSIDCIVSTGVQGLALSPELRVGLCEGATSAIPSQCIRSVHSSVIQRLPRGFGDAVELCRGSSSIAPALCINRLQHVSAAIFDQGMAIKLCAGALSTDPADCFHAAPHQFSDYDRVVLCSEAVSEEPAACAKSSLPRLPLDSHKAELCAKAESTGPAQCASSSPFGMAASDIVTLCRQALDDKPARCADAVPSYLRIPWKDVAAVCHSAKSTTPGSCISHRARQRVPLSTQVIHECRYTTSKPSSLEIAQFTSECTELVPKCPFSMKVRLLDQFGVEMPAWNRGYVHFSVVPDGDSASNALPVHGLPNAAIVNGSALFHRVQFTNPGNFTLRLHSVGVEDMVARIRVYSNEREQREIDGCQRVFSFMQCEKVHWDPTPNSVQANDSPSALQILLLPHRLSLGGLHCEALWSEQHAGLRPLGSISHARLYALPRMAYQLLTGLNVPTRAMSSWACLGIPEGSNRSVIRRAYHKRSLEWHPDKWPLSSDSSASALPLRAKVEEVYTLVNDAYQKLSNREAHSP